MAQYRLAVGTHDPHGLAAGSDGEAIAAAVALVRDRYAADLSTHPQEVATLLGPHGLVTRPGERIDEFVSRVAGAADSAMLQPGDSNAPDCNGD